jgi:cytochrome c oxidase subunit IV
MYPATRRPERFAVFSKFTNAMSSHAATQAEILIQEARRYHTFVNMALLLSVLTGTGIVIIFTPLPYGIMMGALVTLAFIKFMCVILWFMHLLEDPPLLTVLFLAGLFLAVGTLIALLGLMSPEDVDPEVLQGSQLPGLSAPADLG